MCLHALYLVLVSHDGLFLFYKGEVDKILKRITKIDVLATTFLNVYVALDRRHRAVEHPGPAGSKTKALAQTTSPPAGSLPNRQHHG